MCLYMYVHVGAAATEKSAKAEKAKDDKGGKKVVEPGSVDEPGAHQALAVLGIAIIAMGEEIGAEMALRTFNHLVKLTNLFFTAFIPYCSCVMVNQ